MNLLAMTLQRFDEQTRCIISFNTLTLFRANQINDVQVWRCDDCKLKPRPHQQQRRGNIVECYNSNNSFDVVAVFGNNVERVYREISSFRKSRNELSMFNSFRLWRKARSTLLPKTATIVEATFDLVEATFDFVERIVRLVGFDNIVSTLLLVWTGLKADQFGVDYNDFKEHRRDIQLNAFSREETVTAEEEG